MALSVYNLSQNSLDGFTSLKDILQAFNSNLSEEQAWAVFFQSVQYLISNTRQDVYRDIYYYGNSAIRLSKEGDVKINVEFSQDSARQRSSFSMKKEFKTVISGPDVLEALGTAIYKALDFGLSDSEEVHLSPELEALIEFLIEPPAADDDEGIDIERDVEDNPERDQTAYQEIVERCTQRVPSQQNVQQHYRAVCRALATEAIELATFLDNIAKERQLLGDAEKDALDASLNELQRKDWARLWIQIMQQLRHGVRLKKVEQVPCQPSDYELTPFEILLEDIRLHRFKLRRIMENGDIPQKVKSDAHAVILDFIRSRPSLKPVGNRVLKKLAPKVMEPREKLLDDIRKPQKLKPVRPRNLAVRNRRFPFDSDVSSDEESPRPQRKVIIPVAAFQVSTDDSDSYMSESDTEGRHHVQGPVLSPLTPVYPDPDNGMWKRAAARDMIVQPSSCRSLGRRHTISACDAKNGAKHKWQNPIECLSLTLEEVSHIRMVLTKAELESQATNPELYQQLSKGKVCFTCKKTKFSIFNLEWGTKCKFCRRNVCNYCLRKMNVPTEHFEKIPVYTLSPVPISPKVLDALKVYESTGSVPHSPVAERKATPSGSEKSKDDTHSSGSSPDDTQTSARRKNLQRSHTIGVGVGNRPPPNKALLKGPQMSICCDCKTMIMEIIRASRSDVALVSKKSQASAATKTEDQLQSPATPTRNRPSNLDFVKKARPKSLFANFNIRSFSPNDMESDA